jgi:hypothetical protein
VPQFPFLAEIEAAQAIKAAVVVDVRLHIGTQTVYDDITRVVKRKASKEREAVLQT